MSATSQLTDLAWAAGIIEGEGCIHIMKVNVNKSPSGWCVRVSVVNTLPTLIDNLLHIFNLGTIHRYDRGSKKAIYRWTVHGDSALTVLQSVLPYIIAKREQAETAIKARMYQNEHPYTRKGTEERANKDQVMLTAYTVLRELKL